MAILLRQSLWKPHTITAATLSAQQHRERKKKNPNNPHLQSLTVRQRSRRRWLSKNGISACPSHVRGWPCGVLLAEREAKMAVDRRRQQQSPAPPRFPRTIGTQHAAQSTFRAAVLALKKKKKSIEKERRSISGPSCENHKEDIIKQKCLGTRAERRMLNRGVGLY